MIVIYDTYDVLNVCEFQVIYAIVKNHLLSC